MRNTTGYIGLPTQVFFDLTDYMQETRTRADMSELVGLAVIDWLAAAKARAAEAKNADGFQWKELFLPSGTRLRTTFNGQRFHAVVEGDNIVFDGRSVSPSEFANGVGGNRRNAWKVVWLMLPHDGRWKVAKTLRTMQPKRGGLASWA